MWSGEIKFIILGFVSIFKIFVVLKLKFIFYITRRVDYNMIYWYYFLNNSFILDNLLILLLNHFSIRLSYYLLRFKYNFFGLSFFSRIYIKIKSLDGSLILNFIPNFKLSLSFLGNFQLYLSLFFDFFHLMIFLNICMSTFLFRFIWLNWLLIFFTMTLCTILNFISMLILNFVDFIIHNIYFTPLKNNSIISFALILSILTIFI